MGDYTRIFAIGDRKVLARYVTLDFGIEWHNVQGLLCHFDANILVCHPRGHVHMIYVLYKLIWRTCVENWRVTYFTCNYCKFYIFYHCLGWIYNTTTCKCCIYTYPFNSNNVITTVLNSLNFDHFNTSSNTKTEVWNDNFSSKLPIYTLKPLLFYGIRVNYNFCRWI